MVLSVLLLVVASLSTAQTFVGRNIAPAATEDLILPGFGSSLYNSIALAGGCDIGQKTCDGKCMPVTGSCCSLGNGSYCELGYTCGKNGCCRVGAVCKEGDTLSCSAGKTLCGNVCIPSGGQCCDKTAGTWCDSGKTCSTGGKCEIKSSSGSGSCSSTQKLCSNSCIPSTAVCCNNGFYCNAGETCTSDNKCQKLCKRKSRGGKGGSKGGSDCSEGAGSMTTPNILVGLLAMAPLLL